MRLLITALVAVAVAAGAAWYFELWNPNSILNPQPDDPSGQQQGQVAPPNYGGPLYQPAEDPPAQPPMPSAKSDPLVLSSFHVQTFDKRRIPSLREGILLFVGQEVSDEEAKQGNGNYQTVTVYQGEEKPIVKNFRSWQETEIVKPGQMLAMVNPALAIKEVAVKKLQVEIAKEEYKSALALEGEALNKFKREQKLFAQNASTKEAVDIAELVWKKHTHDSRNKFSAIQVAIEEKNKAEIVLDQHTIMSAMKGTAVIKHIFKKDREAIKASEEFIELHNIEVLRAEGTIGPEYMGRIKPGTSVTIEPTREEAPKRLDGHTLEVTGIAFCNKGDSLIVSVSTDRTACVWVPDAVFPIHRWYHPREVLSVACSPKAAEGNWCLTGCADGSLRLWDLTKLSDKDRDPMWTANLPGGAGVTALAFSPDGKFFATGGDDGAIHVWETTTGAHRYRIESRDAHQGTVTSVSFTPQCRLVSAAKDNTIRVWDLREKGAHLIPPVIANRTGTVAHLGVSQNGQWTLFDRGKELHLLSVGDGQVRGILKNPQAISFESLALLSPDPSASLLLTAGAPEGRLQLWQTPIDGARPFEVRQWVPKEKSPVTCAAFAPTAGGAAGSYAASGSRDGYVYLWQVPGQGDVASHPIKGLRLDLVDYDLASGGNVRVGITVPNPISAEHPRGRLKPGQTVQVVIE